MPGKRFSTATFVTLPICLLLFPETKLLKLLWVETSIKYRVAPTSDQFAAKPFWLMFVPFDEVGVTMKFVVEVIRWELLLTIIGPMVAEVGIVMVKVLSVTFVTFASMPLILTLRIVSKLFPLMVTVVPTGPRVGKNELVGLISGEFKLMVAKFG